MFLGYFMLVYLNLISSAESGRDGYHLTADQQAAIQKEIEYAERQIQTHLDKLKQQGQEDLDRKIKKSEDASTGD